MKRIWTYIIVLILMICLILPAQAKQSLLYYDNGIPELNAVLEDSYNQYLIVKRAGVWWEKTYKPGEKFDKAKAEFRFNETLHYFVQFRVTDVAAFIKAVDKNAFLNDYSQKEAMKVYYDVPLYYDGERTPMFARYMLFPPSLGGNKENEFRLWGLVSDYSLERLEEIRQKTDRTAVSKLLVSLGYEGWEPQVMIGMYGGDFYIVKKGTEYKVFCLGGTAGEKDYPTEFQKIKGKLSEVSELQTLFVGADADAAKAEEIRENPGQQRGDATSGATQTETPAAGTTTDTGDTGTDDTVMTDINPDEEPTGGMELIWFVIGGAALLIAAAVAIALLTKKKAK